MDNIVIAKNITYKYFENSKNYVLENVDIAIKERNIVLLTGKSGCGKSTLAYILAGLYPENGGFLLSGEVCVDGMNIHELTPDKRAGYVSMMFQNCDLQFCMNNLHNELTFCLENISTPAYEMAYIIQDVVKLVKAEKLLHRDFSKMSGGEKQKCALCCILAMKSKFIILDEAFANIDVKSAKEIISIIKESGMTVLAIDHHPDLWEGAYDDIICLDGAATSGAAHTALPGVSKKNDKLGGNVITTKNLCINDISFPDMAFAKGSITAILGESGSGKTTFFKALTKQNKYMGSIDFSGRELSKIRKTNLFSKCGIVFQNPSNQFLSMSVYDEILFSVKRWNKGKDDSWHTEKTMELLDVFDLGKYKKYSPYLLSQGQQRRLAVLSMLAGGQEILLLDEPTYGQDYENISNIMNLLLEKAQQGLTVILNTHNERVAQEFADRIIRIEGRNVQVFI